MGVLPRTIQQKRGPAGATSRFIEYTKLVNRADDKTFRERIASFIDVDEIPAGFLAVNTVLSNLDSFLEWARTATST
jgi:spore coat protein CotH